MRHRGRERQRRAFAVVNRPVREERTRSEDIPVRERCDWELRIVLLFAFQRGDVEYRLRDEIVRLSEDVRVNHIQGTDVLTSKKELMELGLDFAFVRETTGGAPVIRKKQRTHRGVEVMLSGDTLKKSESMYQRYIDNALRIDGMPFDYGVYVFLSETCSDGKTKEGKLSYDVWDDVMLRFATNGKFVESTYTNAWSVPSLVNISSSSDSDEKYFQAKTAFARYFGEEKSKALFGSIERHIDDALKAARPYLSNVFTTSAFSLLRFDFVIDEQLYPWLIEVNASPNIKPSSPGQEAMLVRMLDVVSKKLFASEEDIVLPNELVRETDITQEATNENLGTIRIHGHGLCCERLVDVQAFELQIRAPPPRTRRFAHETSQHIHVATGRRAHM